MVIRNGVAKYVFIIFFIVLTAGIGTGLLVYNENKAKGFVRVDAVVVGYKQKYDYDDDQTMYSETVEYVVNGQKYTKQNPVWSSSPKRIGKTIEVAYNPDNPSQCEFVKSQNIFSLVLFIMSGIGAIGLVSQIVMDIKNKKNGKYDDEDRLIA